MNRDSHLIASFPRTLTLSLRERETSDSLAEWPIEVVFRKDGQVFSLSHRERAGVRGKWAHEGMAPLSTPRMLPRCRTH